jgi:hypothetical protein
MKVGTPADLFRNLSLANLIFISLRRGCQPRSGRPITGRALASLPSSPSQTND